MSEKAEPEVKDEGNCAETSCQSITFGDSEASSLSRDDISRADKAKSVYLSYINAGDETGGDS